MASGFEANEPNAFRTDAGVFSDAGLSAISVRCPHCRELGSFDVVRAKAFEFRKSGKSGGNHAVAAFFASIRICPNTKCKGLVFVIQQGPDQIVEIEPPQLLDFNSENLPNKLQETLKEAVACHGAGAYRAAETPRRDM